ncbi:MAG: VOC family protein [Gammaproteobacteria bacterium]
MKTPNVYLHFNGDCEAAFAFYREVFGGEFAEKMRFADAPEGAFGEMSDADAQKIMHVALPLANGMLLGSDIPPGGEKESFGGYSVSLSPESRAELDAIYAALSAEGAKKVMEPEDAFWGDYFGMVIDKFGVRWMLNCESGR